MWEWINIWTIKELSGVLQWWDSTEVEQALRNYGYLHRAQVRIPLEAERINKLIRVSQVKSVSAAAYHNWYGIPYTHGRTTEYQMPIYGILWPGYQMIKCSYHLDYYLIHVLNEHVTIIV